MTVIFIGLLSTYSLVDLHVSPARAFMNDSGVVAGKMYVENGYRCFVWKQGKLQSLPEDVLEVCGMNSHADLAVQTKKGPGRWWKGHLEVAGKEFQGARPGGIDDAGRMVGEVMTGSEGLYAVVFWPPKEPGNNDRFPSRFGPSFAPRPEAVSADGAFVGTKNIGMQIRSPRESVGWMYWNGKSSGIGGGDRFAFPTCISNNHHVGGSYRLSKGLTGLPFAWFDGVFNELPLPDGNQAYGAVVGINDKGDAVGNADWQVKISDGTANLHKAVLWRNGKLEILDDLVPKELGVEVEQAFAINSSGQLLVQVAPKTSHWPRTLAILNPAR